MSDSKIEDLTALTTPDGADLLAIVDDPAGTPETKKITVTNLLSLASGGDVFEDIGIVTKDLMADSSRWVASGTGTEYSTGWYTGAWYVSANNNAIAVAYSPMDRPRYYDGNYFFDKESFVNLGIRVSGGTGKAFAVVGNRYLNSAFQESGNKMYGLFLNTTTLSALTDTGASQTLANYGSGYLSGRDYIFNHHFTPAVSVKFYRDGVLTNTITTTLPSGNMSWADSFYNIGRATTTTSGGSMSVYMLQVKIRQ